MNLKTKKVIETAFIIGLAVGLAVIILFAFGWVLLEGLHEIDQAIENNTINIEFND